MKMMILQVKLMQKHVLLKVNSQEKLENVICIWNTYNYKRLTLLINLLKLQKNLHWKRLFGDYGNTGEVLVNASFLLKTNDSDKLNDYKYCCWLPKKTTDECHLKTKATRTIKNETNTKKYD